MLEEIINVRGLQELLNAIPEYAQIRRTETGIFAYWENEEGVFVFPFFIKKNDLI